MDPDQTTNGTVYVNNADEPVDRTSLRLLKTMDMEHTGIEALDVIPDKSPAQLAQEIFGRAFLEPQLNLEDLFPYRLQVAWRIVREMARIRGIIAPGDPLSCVRDVTNPDPWHIPEIFTASQDKRNYRNVPLRALQIIKEAENLAKAYQVSFSNPANEEEENGRIYYPGFALMPPCIPHDYLELSDYGRLVPNKEYSPENDYNLIKYIQLLEEVNQSLQLYAGSEEEPNIGKYGLQGLRDPTTLRLAMPSAMQIVTFEEIVIDEMLDLVVQYGIRRAEHMIDLKYGLCRFEVLNLIKLAKGKAKEQTECDLEESRGIMLMRLESFLNRSKGELNLRAELGGLKQIAMIQGLHKSEQGDVMKDFIDVVRGESKRRDDIEAAEDADFSIDDGPPAGLPG